MMRNRIDGEGIVWGAGAFVASIVAGVVMQPDRNEIGLENATIIYLLIVVIAAAYGGRTAGLVAALSAALSYDFFLTTPYNRLTIDSVSQVVTVALLFGSGLVASLAGRARRRSGREARQQADAIRLLNAITQAVAAGADADRLAAGGLRQLLDVQRVTITRGGPAGQTVVAADAAAEGDAAGGEPPDLGDVPHLDEQGRLPRGIFLVRDGHLPRPVRGAAVILVHDNEPVGELVVITGTGHPLPPGARLIVATVAHALAAAEPRRPTSNGRRSLAR
jgi:Domain of unknown function (DUF4118)